MQAAIDEAEQKDEPMEIEIPPTPDPEEDDEFEIPPTPEDGMEIEDGEAVEQTPRMQRPRHPQRFLPQVRIK